MGGEHIVLDKYTSPVGEEFLDVDDLPEALDSGPSSDDEAFSVNSQPISNSDLKNVTSSVNLSNC